MDVPVPRREQLSALARRMERDFVVTINPDHPQLLTGPDILAGSDGHLLAVFLPRAQELSSPDRLVARLILSRLALPAHTKCVLFLSRDDLERNSEVVRTANDFHAVLSLGARLPRKALLDRKLGRPTQEIPAAIRSMVRHRARRLIGVSLAQRHDGGLLRLPTGAKRLSLRLTQQFSVEPHAPLWHRAEVQVPRLLRRSFGDVVLTDDLLLAVRVTRRPESLFRRLEPFLASSLLLNYSIDSGVPFPAIKMASLLITANLSHSSSDQQKPLRAAALAGWAVVEPTGWSDIEDAIEEASLAARDQQ